VTVGVRPEHLERNPQGLFRFPVETVEALGADSLVHGAFGDTMLVARVDGHETPEPGTALAFQPMPGRLYFFDTASGQRLRA
jgi:sn-glycerol 3-phosphate transport system ATP-binding protein